MTPKDSSYIKKRLRRAIFYRNYYDEESGIYNIQEGVIAKPFPHYKRGIHARNEFRIGSWIRDSIRKKDELQRKSQNISTEFWVPKMYRTIRPDTNPEYLGRADEINMWYVVMEEIRGDRISNLDNNLRERALEEYKSRIINLLDFRVIPIVHDPNNNAIFNHEKDRLYLVNFHKWKTASKEEMELYQEQVAI
jgi:hypothetical protein